MKEILKKAHQLTREIKAKYNDVDYKTQLGLFISYLLENKEEKSMLKDEIKKELKKMGEAEGIEVAESVFSKYETLTNEIVEELYSDSAIRRSMKAKELWDSKSTGKKMIERYLGEGNVEILRQKLWVKGDKIRIYYDITVDGQFTITGNWIKIK